MTGLVPYEPEMVQLANGDVIAVRTWPCWGMDVKCGKNTDISYGPWADRQRYAAAFSDDVRIVKSDCLTAGHQLIHECLFESDGFPEIYVRS